MTWGARGIALAGVAGLALGASADAPMDDREPFEEVGELECEVTRLSYLVVYSRADFTCGFDAMQEQYQGHTVQRGLAFKWNFGERVGFKVYRVKKKREVDLEARSLGGRYRGMNLGLALGVGGDLEVLQGGRGDQFALTPKPQSSTGLGISWTFGSLYLEPVSDTDVADAAGEAPAP